MVKEISGQSEWTSEVIDSEVPVFVDFWAPWCGPCRMVAPLVEQFAEENASRMKTVKVNVDDNSEVAMQYGIQSIPSLMLFKSGQPVVSIRGAVPKSEIETQVTPHLD